MRPRAATTKFIWVKAGGMCAFPGCRHDLVQSAAGPDTDALLGEVAHIVGRSEVAGPRAEAPVPGGDRNGVANLLLLCPTHHEVVDRQVQTYTVERLVAMKADHERWVREVWARERLASDAETAVALPLVSDLVHSTLLPVDRMPRFIYTAPCDLDESDVRPRLRQPADRNVMLPYIVREHKLIAFADLSEAEGPFADVVEHRGSERHDSEEWWRDPNLSSWYVSLLNRALNKLTGRRGLRFDKEHRRYYFVPEHDAAGEGPPLPRSVTYRPLNKAKQERFVVWQPVSKRTGQPRRHWTHLAVGLRFHRVAPTRWVLSVRPEYRFTTDGETPVAPRGIGRRATRLKARMYNIDVLTELQFWKEFLSDGTPRLIFAFGGQALVVDAEFLTTQVEWSGVPDDVQPFANVAARDDLFTMAAYEHALAESGEAELDEWEAEELAELEALEETDDGVLEDDDLVVDQGGAEASS